jgi:ion channel-forming bestrophin family protein
MMQGYPNPTESRSFWRDAIAWKEAVTAKVLPRIGVFGAYAVIVSVLHGQLNWRGMEATHIGYTGGALALLLVLRSNGGYDRWWEARKLWGGIVNQSRNLAIKGLTYGPTDPLWRDRFVRWSAAFSHACRQSLRGERNESEFVSLLGAKEATELATAEHLPGHAATRIAALLHRARLDGTMDGYAFLETDRERAQIIDHLGGCERILKTPYPLVHTIKLRRFILLYLLGLPLAIASSSEALMGAVTMLVAYPLLAIDHISQEIENPFAKDRASHLPLDAICRTIEGNLLALLGSATNDATAPDPGEGPSEPPPRPPRE